jgi:hypothetical protein
MKFIVAGGFAILFLFLSTLFGIAIDRKLPDQAKAILDKATVFELYSLEPDEEEKPAVKPEMRSGCDNGRGV